METEDIEFLIDIIFKLYRTKSILYDLSDDTFIILFSVLSYARFKSLYLIINKLQDDRNIFSERDYQILQIIKLIINTVIQEYKIDIRENYGEANFKKYCISMQKVKLKFSKDIIILNSNHMRFKQKPFKLPEKHFQDFILPEDNGLPFLEAVEVNLPHNREEVQRENDFRDLEINGLR